MKSRFVESISKLRHKGAKSPKGMFCPLKSDFDKAVRVSDKFPTNTVKDVRIYK